MAQDARCAWRYRLLLVVVCGCSAYATCQVSLGTAIDLALRNSDQVKVAMDEQARARASLSEIKDAYVPSMSITSGLAKGTGFPLGDPSVAKLVAQGLLFNDAQPKFVRAARAAWHASELAVENARQQVVLDAALTYAELDADDRCAATLNDQEKSAAEMVRIEQDRSDAGLESKLTLKKVQLRAAQARLKRLDLQARADVLREHLASLTGVTAAAFRTQPGSLPRFPALGPDLESRQMAIDSSAAVKSAYEEAKSKRFFAEGQHRINFRPEVDLLAQFGYISDFNDYSRYYVHGLPPNNAVAGVAIQLPLWNAAQAAKAREADAEAAKATHEADLQRSQAGEQLVQLRRAVEQTEAAAEVARLQHEISSDNLDAMRLRAQQGGEANGAAVSPADVSGSAMEERGLLADAILAELEHTRAELQWMHAVGTLTSWAQSALTAEPLVLK